jgi:glycosidase
MKRALSLLFLVTLVACDFTVPPTAQPIPPTPTTHPTPTAQPTPTPSPTLPTTQPKWFDDAVIYQIFPRSFFDTNGNGIGDLNGIAQKLDYIKSLGANTIWLTPHYPSNTYHGYAVTDYVSVGAEYGTLDDFKKLVLDVKRKNMRLIVDYVANHSSNEHPFFKDAFRNPPSKYSPWYKFSNDNNDYSSFFGVKELPQWNHENPEVRKYLIDAALFWLDLGVDGLRCDYALGANEIFWKELRVAVKSKHPNAVILGEVWDSNTNTLRRYFENGFDALFDFPFALVFIGSETRNGDGVLNGQLPSFGLWKPLNDWRDRYPKGAQIVRFVSNHDFNRLASESSGDLRKMKLAAAVTLLTPGIPKIYYGEEIGMSGTKGTGPIYDEYRREPMDWYAAETGAGMANWFKPDDRNNKPNDRISVEEQEASKDSLLNFYRQLGEWRNKYPSLRTRDFQIITQVPGCENDCLALWSWKENQLAQIVFNFSDKTVNASPAFTPPIPPNSQTPKQLLGALEGGSSKIEPWGVSIILW